MTLTKKVQESITILDLLGLPKEQQNERSALTLLALINLKPNGEWSQLCNPLIGVTPIMEWCEKYYKKKYAPNSRETFRRFTLHQFVQGGICVYNPDKPERPVNSPKACYQIAPEVLNLLKTFQSDKWNLLLDKWLSQRKTLAQQYAMDRKNSMIPIKIDSKETISLSPGKHSLLIRDIVEELAPRFFGGAELIYVGDTGAKEDFFKEQRLKQLGVRVDRKGKLPDVILYLESKNWIILIESVTSHGPVDSKRYKELNTLFRETKAGLVFVSAFPNRKVMTKFLADISWETEVWNADSPSHLIHFNGHKFLGPF